MNPQVADFGGSMVLQPTILIMARPGNEYVLDAYIRPFTTVRV